MSTSTPKWIIRISNPSQADFDFIDNLQVKACMVSYETVNEAGEETTPHIQGSLIFNRSYRFPQLKKLHCSAYWEAMKVSDLNYANKVGSKILRNEDNRHQGKVLLDNLINDHESIETFREAHKMVFCRYKNGITAIYDARQKPRTFKTEVFWLYGPTGSGKTRWVHENYPTVVTVSPARGFLNGYENQEFVLIDDFRKGDIPWNDLLKMCDRYAHKVDVKYGSKHFNSKKLFFTSNRHPENMAPHEEDKHQLIRRIEHIMLIE